MGDNKGRTLYLFYHASDGKCFAGAGNAKQRLPGQTGGYPLRQLVDGPWLVPPWFEFRNNFEPVFHHTSISEPAQQVN